MIHLRAIVLVLVTVAAASVLTQAGCGSARREAPLVGPVDVSTPPLQLGQQVFMNHCYQCHPGGRAGVGPALNDKPLPQVAIRTQVRAGLGAMPGFGEQRISDEELHALGRYVVALREAGGS